MGKITREVCEELDRGDGLAGFRDRFYVPETGIYLDGNSLGLLSRDAESAVLQILGDWKRQAIEGWNASERPWIQMAERLGAQTAKLIGADEDEVVVTNSTTVNLHQLLSTLYVADAARPKILADALNFPSDLYAIESFLERLGRDSTVDRVLVASSDGYNLDEQAIIDAFAPPVQMAVLPAVVFASGQLLDIERLTRAAHERGIVIGFDCSHSVGSVPHQLSRWGVDFAFWCSYKHLNGGPGAAGGLFLNRRHFGKTPGLAGWFGCDKTRQFEMACEFFPADSAGALQIGTPNVLSMAPLLGSLPIMLEAGIERVREKSLQLTRLLIDLTDQELAELGYGVASPREASRRGGHLAVTHPEAYRISLALRSRGIIPDYRRPNIVRLAPVALYNRFVDVWDGVVALKEIVDSDEYCGFESVPGLVT